MTSSIRDNYSRVLALQSNQNSIDPSVSATLKCNRANQSVSFASSDRGLTTTWLYSAETHTVFLDFRHFQAGSVDFQLVMVK